MRSIYQPAEVAALVGGLVTDAPAEHYTKRRAAWLRHEICNVPVPMPEQVKMMERTLEPYEERNKAQELRTALAERRREIATKKRLSRRRQV